MTAEAVESQNYLYSGGHPINYYNILRPQLLAMPQVYPEACKKTWVQDKKSES